MIEGFITDAPRAGGRDLALHPEPRKGRLMLFTHCHRVASGRFTMKDLRDRVLDMVVECGPSAGARRYSAVGVVYSGSGFNISAVCSQGVVPLPGECPETTSDGVVAWVDRHPQMGLECMLFFVADHMVAQGASVRSAERLITHHMDLTGPERSIDALYQRLSRGGGRDARKARTRLQAQAGPRHAAAAPGQRLTAMLRDRVCAKLGLCAHLRWPSSCIQSSAGTRMLIAVVHRYGRGMDMGRCKSSRLGLILRRP